MIDNWHWIHNAGIVVGVIYFTIALLQSKTFDEVRNGGLLSGLSRVSSRNLAKLVDRTLASASPRSWSGKHFVNPWRGTKRLITCLAPLFLVALHMQGHLEVMVESLSTETFAFPTWMGLISVSEEGGRLMRLGDVKSGTLERCDVLFFCGNPNSLKSRPGESRWNMWNRGSCTPMWLMRHPDESIAVYRTIAGIRTPSQVTVTACKRGIRVTEGKLLRRIWLEGPTIQTLSQRIAYTLYRRPLPDRPLTLEFRHHEGNLIHGKHLVVSPLPGDPAERHKDAHLDHGNNHNNDDHHRHHHQQRGQVEPILDIYAEKLKFKRRRAGG